MVSLYSWKCWNTWYFTWYEILKGICEDNNYTQKFDSKQTDEMQFVIKQCENGLSISIFNFPLLNTHVGTLVHINMTYELLTLPEFNPFFVGFVFAQSFVLCVVFWRTFSIGHCIACHSLIYGFLLPFIIFSFHGIPWNTIPPKIYTYRPMDWT